MNFWNYLKIILLWLTSSTITVGTAPAGPLFTAVRSIIQTNCAVAGCHNGSQSPNFTIDCNIAANAGRIKLRAVDQEAPLIRCLHHQERL
jgi:hypothetical protein